MKTLVKLQDDLYIPEDFAEDHRYFADAEGKKKYTGITTILGTLAKPMLIPWAARMASEYVASVWEAGRAYTAEEIATIVETAKGKHKKDKEKAGEHGTSQHALCEEYIKLCIQAKSLIGIGDAMLAGLWTNNDKSARMSLIAPFIMWAVENVKEFLFAERPVHSKSLFLAGTIDFGAVMKDGKRRIGDLKTGSGIYYEAILQCEAYQLLAEEEGDTKYDGSVIVRLGKDGTFQTQERERGEIDEDAFFGLLKAYRGSQTFIKPKK